MLSDTPRTMLRRTTDHNEIMEWITRREGVPAQVRGTAGGEDENAPGVLAILFPNDRSASTLEPLTWYQFFEKFERAGLVFEYASIGNGHVNDYTFTERFNTHSDYGSH